MADEKDKQKGSARKAGEGRAKEKPKSRSTARAGAKGEASKPKTGARRTKGEDKAAPAARGRGSGGAAAGRKAADAKQPSAKETGAKDAGDATTGRREGAAKPAARRRPSPRTTQHDGRGQVERPVVRARAKYVRSSPRKARLVIEHVRGKSVGDARAVLRHSPRGVARELERLLASAVANAENNHDLVSDDLYVKEIYADEGPTIKRFRPRAQGRAYRVRKRTSHLTVALSTKE
jgi:ribosomal protein L22